MVYCGGYQLYKFQERDLEGLDGTMNEPVQRSEPVKTTMTRPMGKIMAEIILMRPGAFSWYHGDEFVTSETAQAKDKRQPAMKELKKILSIRMFALATPAREHSSTVSLGE